MKPVIQRLLVISVVWIATLWFLMPAWASWHWGHSSLVRFDPQVSKDYNCIFIEGHAANYFNVTWLMAAIPDQYLRLRYTPLRDDQCHGIMFIDPQTLAYEAHVGCANVPTNLTGRLDSPQIILNWMRSQPHAAQSASHTNDAQEIFDAIHVLAPLDLEHFAWPTNQALKNFAIGHQSLVKRDFPGFMDIWCLALLWLGEISRAKRRLKAGSSPPPL